MNSSPFLPHVDTSPPGGKEPLRLAQTSLILGNASRLVSSSQGLAWPGLYCAVTEELPHEAVHRAVPALWLVTTDTPLQIHRDVLGGTRCRETMPRQRVSLTAPGEAVCDEIGNPLTACHVFLDMAVLEEVALEHFETPYEARPLVSQFALDEPVLRHLMATLRLALTVGDGPGPAAMGFDGLQADCVAHALAAYVLGHFSPGCAAGASRVRALNDRFGATLLRRLLDYLEAHLDSDLSLDDLASLAGLSKTRFLRRFQASLGVSPHQYLIGRRLQRAKRLLRAGRHTIGEIAQLCGFADPAHFSASFRRREGISASQFRKAHRG